MMYGIICHIINMLVNRNDQRCDNSKSRISAIIGEKGYDNNVTIVKYICEFEN